MPIQGQMMFCVSSEISSVERDLLGTGQAALAFCSDGFARTLWLFLRRAVKDTEKQVSLMHR